MCRRRLLVDQTIFCDQKAGEIREAVVYPGEGPGGPGPYLTFSEMAHFL